jgi:hypothetical protein
LVETGSDAVAVGFFELVHRGEQIKKEEGAAPELPKPP